MRYTEIAKATPFSGAPKLHIPSAWGASPGKPILFRIPVTGQRPITYSAVGLPQGITLEGNILSGKVATEGDFPILLSVENALGKDEKQLLLTVRPGSVQLSPLMGFTSWNAFAFRVRQENMEQAADLLVATGLAEYGYRYVNTDSGWQAGYGGPFDAVMPNAKFPDMKAMVKHIHEKGLLAGIYSSPMLVCFGCAMTKVPAPLGTTLGEPDERFADERGGIGKIRKEKNNALQWADWGFDYLKYDWRPCDTYNAELMRQALMATDRDFGFCVSVKALPEDHEYWEKYCNSYRCNPDCHGTWEHTMEIYRSYFAFYPHVNRGHYFDLDMLDIGECDLLRRLPTDGYVYRGYTEDEQILVYSLRAFFASPLQISGKLDAMTDFERDVYCNDEIIAIHQDLAFDAAKPLSICDEEDKKLHIWKRYLEGGDQAVAVFNFGTTDELAEIPLEKFGSVRDVWAKKDLGEMDCISVKMHPHTVRIFRISC